MSGDIDTDELRAKVRATIVAWLGSYVPLSINTAVAAAVAAALESEGLLALSVSPAGERDEAALLAVSDLLSKACELLGDVPWSGSERYRRWRITANNLVTEAEALFAAPRAAGERDTTEAGERHTIEVEETGGGVVVFIDNGTPGGFNVFGLGDWTVYSPSGMDRHEVDSILASALAARPAPVTGQGETVELNDEQSHVAQLIAHGALSGLHIPGLGEEPTSSPAEPVLVICGGSGRYVGLQPVTICPVCADEVGDERGWLNRHYLPAPAAPEPDETSDDLLAQVWRTTCPNQHDGSRRLEDLDGYEGWQRCPTCGCVVSTQTLDALAAPETPKGETP